MAYENKLVDGRSLKQGLQGILDKVKSTKIPSATSADQLTTSRDIILEGAVTGTASFNGTSDARITTTLGNLDASKITSGTISIDRLPQGALERLVIVENDEARFQLTEDRVQNGDTVKVNDTQKMYFVKDQSQLSSEAGYEVYATGKATAVDWSGVQGKPEEFPPEAHNQASNTITAMTGYQKTGSGAIGTGDTLNQAIGKLEVGLDGKFNKSGGDVDGTINSKARVTVKSTIGDRERYQIGFDEVQNRFFIYDSVNSVSVLDYTTNNKHLTLNAQNLQTVAKEVVGAINEVRTKANEVDDKLDKGGYVGNAQNLKSEIDGKEPKIDTKNSGFNLNKSDLYNSSNSNLLFTQKGANDLYTELNRSISSKLDKGDYEGTANDLKGLVDQLEVRTSKNLELLKGNGGIEDVFYIQDVGKKEMGKGYVDKVTNELYICLVENSDTDIKLGKFELATNIENRYRLMRLEQRLGVYQPVYGIKELIVSRDENNSSPSLTYTQK